MRFMTWNVWGRLGDPWSRRQRAIVETIHAERPEFVALQETWAVGEVSQVDLLAAELGMSSAFAPSRMPQGVDADGQLGLGILSRYPIVGVDQYPLSGETIALRTEIWFGDHSLHFLTTCLDWEEDHHRERERQVDALIELTTKLAAADDEVVLAGCLNAPPDRPEIERLREALYECGPDAGPTYSSHNPYLGHGEWLEDHRIDYVLTAREPADPDHCRSWPAGLEEDEGNPPSAHYAVVSDIPVTV
jgi:endonuclease/exonuclease/phosphatase family metal-dependent hydrolase